MSSFRHIIWVASILFVLSACGGGSSSSGDSEAPTLTYPVTASVAGSGSGSISPTSQTVSQGSTTSFTISPASDSTIAGVSGCGGSLSGSTYTTGAINSSCTVTASFDLSTLPTASAGGIWRGYAQLGIDWYEYTGLVTEAGRAYFTTDGGAFLVSVQITNDGTVITGGPITGANSVIAVLNGDPNFYYLPPGTPPLFGTLLSRSTIDAKAIFPSGETLLIEVSYDEANYERGSSLATMAGGYEGVWDLFDEEIVLAISETGTLTARAPKAGCDVSGMVSVPNSSYNLYEIQYSFSGCTDAAYSPLNGVTFTGLAALLPHDTSLVDPHLYLRWLSTGVVNGMVAGDYQSFRGTSSTSAGGIWKGSMTFDGTSTPLALDGVITTDGQVRLRDSDGSQLFGQLDAFEDAVGGDVSWSLQLNATTPGGSVQGEADIVASLVERTSLGGEITFYGNNGDVQAASFILNYDPIYEKTSSLALLAGTYQNSGHTMIVDAGGSVLFTSTITDCVHEGFASVADRYNAYQLDLLTSSCTGNYEFLNGTTMTGLAYLLDGTSPADTLVYRAHATLSNGRDVVGNWELQR